MPAPTSSSSAADAAAAAAAAKAAAGAAAAGDARDARRAALSLKAAEPTGAASAKRSRDLSDFLVPGMLNLSIDKALLVLSELCYKLQENQLLAQRLYNRMLFLRFEVEHKAVGARIQSDVILRYGEQVGKAIVFLRKHGDKTLVARVAATRRFLDGLRALHARLDSFFAKVGLAQRPEMHAWRDEHWAGDLALQQQLLRGFLSNRHVVLAELTERGVEEALTEIRAELARHEREQPSPAHTELLRLVVDSLRFQFATFQPEKEVPTWFLARDEVTFKQEPFATGSYGALYRGSLASTPSRKVVVKSLYSDSKQTQRALYAECAIWSALDNPHVLRLIGACYVGSPLFLVCDDAGDRRSFPEFFETARQREKLWRLLLEAARGLQYVHARGVVHNNIKGSNLLVGVDGRAKVSDFAFSFSTARPPDPRQLRHATGMRWKAPELLLADGDARPTFASDVYSFGMTILECVTGERPWSRCGTDQEVIERLRREQLPERPAGLSDKQWALVTRLCAFKSADRPTIDQAVAALEDVVQTAERRAVEATKECAKCKSANPSANKFCNECGNRFP